MLTGHTWLDALFIVGLVGGAEEVLRRLIGKPLVRFVRKTHRFLDTWNGDPARDGLPPRPGVVDRIIAIEAQVKNNGGSSMKDAVDRIERGLSEHVQKSEQLLVEGTKDKAAILARQASHEATITALAEAVSLAVKSTPPVEDGTHD